LRNGAANAADREGWNVTKMDGLDIQNYTDSKFRDKYFWEWPKLTEINPT
jgi:hypothetical protein